MRARSPRVNSWVVVVAAAAAALECRETAVEVHFRVIYWRTMRVVVLQRGVTRCGEHSCCVTGGWGWQAPLSASFVGAAEPSSRAAVELAHYGKNCGVCCGWGGKHTLWFHLCRVFFSPFFSPTGSKQNVKTASVCFAREAPDVAASRRVMEQTWLEITQLLDAELWFHGC